MLAVMSWRLSFGPRRNRLAYKLIGTWASVRKTALSEKCSGEVIRLSHLSGIPTIRPCGFRIRKPFRKR